jgi:hypothetical protein
VPGRAVVGARPRRGCRRSHRRPDAGAAGTLAIPPRNAIKTGQPDPDFDGVNSPVLVDDMDVAGRTVVLVTANGTEVHSRACQ